MGIIFDLDQTIIDSSIAEQYRKAREWNLVYSKIPSFKLYDEIPKVFKFIIDHNIPVCIVTSSPSIYCTKVLDHWKIPYDSMVCYHDTKRRKPDPDPILLGLSKLKIDPNKALSFGDRDIDIISSKSANVKSVACLWGSENNTHLINSNPDYIINTPLEAIEIIKTAFALQ